MRAITTGELATWIMEHRSNKAFVDSSLVDIVNDLNERIKNLGMVYAINDSGNVCGIVTFTELADNETLFIDNILTTERWVIKKFVQMFKDVFPNHKLMAARNSRYKPYNTSRLLQLIERMK